MMNRKIALRTLISASLVALALAGCGQMKPAQRVDVFEGTLSGAQEVPRTTSTGTGQAEVTYSESTGKINWKVTFSGMTGPATAAHIHGPAGGGQNAGVVIPFGTALAAQPLSGEATITLAQYADLAAGLYYVNIHSSRFPGGEIRAQLRKRM